MTEGFGEDKFVEAAREKGLLVANDKGVPNYSLELGFCRIRCEQDPAKVSRLVKLAEDFGVDYDLTRLVTYRSSLNSGAKEVLWYNPLRLQGEDESNLISLTDYLNEHR